MPFSRCVRVVVSTWFDELELSSRLGVELVYFSVAEFESLAKDVPEAEVGAGVDFLKRYPVSEVEGAHFGAAARQDLGMVAVADRYGLSGIAIEDFNKECYRSLGYRPHLYLPDLGERFCTVGLEADVLAVLATVMAGRCAGRIGMFTEFYTIDPHRDLVLMGHPGLGELSFAQPDTIQVTPDIEIDDSQDRGVWISYRSRGLFAGLSLSGSTLAVDEGANAAYYGAPGLCARDILGRRQAPPSPSGLELKRALDKYTKTSKK